MSNNLRLRRHLAISAPLLLLAACNGWSGAGTRPGPDGSAQTWDSKAEAAWSDGGQGSRMMPLSWFQALAQPDSTAAFAADSYLAGFRIVPRPGRLPLGFVEDAGPDDTLRTSRLRWFDGQRGSEKWVGLNCSACHTAVLEYGGQPHRIDGGPSLFDYQAFVEALDKALHQTLASAAAGATAGQARFDAFARKVLAATPTGSAADTAANRAALRDALGKLVAWEDRVEAMNTTVSRYGYGRVDAFGHIFNKIALFTDAAHPTANPASAPVSYPYIWDIYRHDHLQYNGIVDNARLSLGGGKYIDYGALGRNTGEVIGVFGDVVTAPNPALAGYASSVRAANLERLERLLSTLAPPKWPAELTPPDGTDAGKAQVAQGKALFDQHCAACHAPQPGTQPYKVGLTPQRLDDPNHTDGWMACNALRYRSAPGNLADTPVAYIGAGPVYDTSPAPNASLLATTVKGVLVGKKGQIIGQTALVFLGVGGLPIVTRGFPLPGVDPILQACYDSANPLMRYKSRPLDGIWATAPYLHNGSVPNLTQLLLPPAQRVKSFAIGTRRFDPENVGYSIDPAAPGNSFIFDTRLPGNSNEGHDYGASQFDNAKRQALIAYLKTL